MENQTTETTQEQTTTAPPPVTEKATVNPGNGAQASGQASTESKTETPQTDKGTQAKKFFQQREEKREQKLSEQLSQRLAALEAELKTERERKAQQTQPEPEPDILTDPEGWRKRVEENAAKRAEESYRTAAEKSAAEAAYRQKAEGAEQWLLTRSHLKQDQALEAELAGIIAKDYGHLTGVDPQAAAELAYLKLCRQKGIAPDMDLPSGSSNQAAKGTTSAGVRPTAPAPGKRVWAKGEKEAYLMAAVKNPVEYKRRLAEVEGN